MYTVNTVGVSGSMLSAEFEASDTHTHTHPHPIQQTLEIH